MKQNAKKRQSTVVTVLLLILSLTYVSVLVFRSIRSEQKPVELTAGTEESGVYHEPAVTVTDDTDVTALVTTEYTLTAETTVLTAETAVSDAVSAVTETSPMTSAAPVTTAATTAAPVTTAAPETTSSAAAVQTETAPAVTAPAGSRSIYLTFDDGPCKNTPQVLDILDQYGAKATFFTVGMFVNKYPEYAAETAKRGNLIACHTYTHEFDQCYASADAFMNEVAQWENAVEKACGYLPERECVRFPGGSKTKHADGVRDAIKQRLYQNNYRWFDWDAGDNDKWPAGNVNHLPEEEYYWQSYVECMNWFRDEPGKHVVFLFHDTEIGTVNVLPRILQDLKDRGYGFHLLNEHPKWQE